MYALLKHIPSHKTQLSYNEECLCSQKTNVKTPQTRTVYVSELQNA